MLKNHIEGHHGNQGDNKTRIVIIALELTPGVFLTQGELVIGNQESVTTAEIWRGLTRLPKFQS